MSRHNQSMYAPPHPGQVLEQCFNQSFTVERAAAQMGVAPQVLHDVMAEQAPLTVTLAVLLTRAIPEIEAAIPEIEAAVWIRMQAQYACGQASFNPLFQRSILAHYPVTAS